MYCLQLFVVGEKNNSVPPHSKGDNPTMQLPRSSIVYYLGKKREVSAHLKVNVPSTQGKKRSYDIVSSGPTQAKRRCSYPLPKPSPSPPLASNKDFLKLTDASKKPDVSGNLENMLKNPTSTAPRPQSSPAFSPLPTVTPLGISRASKFHTSSLSECSQNECIKRKFNFVIDELRWILQKTLERVAENVNKKSCIFNNIIKRGLKSMASFFLFYMKERVKSLLNLIADFL